MATRSKSRQSCQTKSLEISVTDSPEITVSDYVEPLEISVTDSPEITVSDYVEPLDSNCQKTEVSDSNVNTYRESPKSTSDLNICDKENEPSIETRKTSSISAARWVPYKPKSRTRSKSQVPSRKRSHTECNETSSNDKSESSDATKFQGYWPEWHSTHPGVGSLPYTWNPNFNANLAYNARLLNMQEALISASEMNRIYSENRRRYFCDQIYRPASYPVYYPNLPDPRLGYPSHIPSYSVYTPYAKLDYAPNFPSADVYSLQNIDAGPFLPIYNHESYVRSPLHPSSTWSGYFSEASSMGFGSLPSFCFMEPGVPLDTSCIRPGSSDAAPVSNSNISGEGSGSASDIPSTEFTSTPSFCNIGPGFPFDTLGTKPVFHHDIFGKTLVFPSEISRTNIPGAISGFFQNESKTKLGSIPIENSLGSIPLSNEFVPGLMPLSLSNTYGTESTVCTEESDKTPSSLSCTSETNNISLTNETELPSYPQIADKLLGSHPNISDVEQGLNSNAIGSEPSNP
ncbi:uncharacterized protein [Palaemon carinicauda]|uniref:uncharacterized protein n=1 Tax=Palaemon carinicauda TaxID=392227 RepID=UPI0035B5AB6C